MPIVLIDDTEERHELRVGDSVIYYTKAPGEEVERELDATRGPDGAASPSEAGSRLMLAHVVGWDGIVNSRGEAVPFAPDAVERVVRALPYGVRLRLDAAIVSGWVEAQESGKG